MNYDGSRKRRVKGEDGETHHFDRARTAIMAADILSRRRFSTESGDEEVERVIGQVTIADLDRHNHRVKSQAKNPFRPPPRNWM